MLQKFTCYLLLLLLVAYLTSSQSVYRLDITRDIKSTKTYCLRTHQFGYLWIATSNGVYRYNGYKLEPYNSSNGLYNPDVWGLHLDNKQRLWLSSIFDQFAYVRNNQIRHAIIEKQKTIYPKHLVSSKRGIVFLTPYHDQQTYSLCIEENDTIRSYSLAPFTGFFFLQDTDVIINCRNDSLLKIHFGLTPSGKLNLSQQFLWTSRGASQHLLNAKGSFIFRNKIVTYKADSLLYYFDIDRRKFAVTPLPTPIEYAIPERNSVFAFGQGTIYSLDSNLQFNSTYLLRNLAPNQTITSADCSYFIDDSLWGKCLATYRDGIFFSLYSDSTLGKLKDTAKHEGTFVGEGFNWIEKQKILIDKRNKTKPARYQLPVVENMERVKVLSSGVLLIVNANRILLYDPHTLKLTDFYSSFDSIRRNPGSLLHPYRGAGGFEISLKSDSDFYVLSKTTGLNHYQYSGQRLSINVVDYERYDGLCYDSSRNLTWIYKADYIAAYRRDRQILKCNNEMLRKYEVRNVRQLLADKYGNIFIRTQDRLLLFNDRNNIIKNLFPDYVLVDAVMRLKSDMLLVGSKSGVFVSAITGAGQVSRPMVYRNTKCLHYKELSDMYTWDNSIVLETDKGHLHIPIPSGSEIFKAPRESYSKYRLLGFYNDSYHDLLTTDTVILEQNGHNSLAFDIVNPAGVGETKFKYIIPQLGLIGQSDIINTSVFSPGKLYSLKLTVQDGSWRSKEQLLKIYILPYWWQEPGAQKWLWMSGVITALFLLFGVIYGTRYVVIRAEEKKNLYLSLELRAIHAQINPHFIYNTLSGILFYINRNMVREAASHLHKFSRLLRAYLSSSRSQTIVIADEISQLTDYIQLQQARFLDKFDYEITTDENIETSKVRIPTLLLQPIVENAIHHGLFHRKKDGMLRLQFFRTAPDRITILVEDNGIGLQRTKEANKEGRKSYGNQLIQDLIRAFASHKEMHIGISYHEKEVPETGLVVQIRIRYRNDVGPEA